jgi:PhnB protein
MPFKPAGYTSVAPYLLVADADATLKFVETVFGAERLRVTLREDGRTRHAEARIDDTVIMMGEIPGGSTAHIHVYVADVDATIARAVAAGGRIIHEIAEQDGDRRGGVADSKGTVWWISTQLSEVAK